MRGCFDGVSNVKNIHRIDQTIPSAPIYSANNNIIGLYIYIYVLENVIILLAETSKLMHQLAKKTLQLMQDKPLILFVFKF